MVLRWHLRLLWRDRAFFFGPVESDRGARITRLASGRGQRADTAVAPRRDSAENTRNSKAIPFYLGLKRVLKVQNVRELRSEWV